jgi:hypothetical protein
MKLMYERCAGLDVHKDAVVACVRTGSTKSARSRRRLQGYWS